MLFGEETRGGARGKMQDGEPRGRILVTLCRHVSGWQRVRVRMNLCCFCLCVCVCVCALCACVNVCDECACVSVYVRGVCRVGDVYVCGGRGTTADRRM